MKCRVPHPFARLWRKDGSKRADVTALFALLVTKLSSYYDRLAVEVKGVHSDAYTRVTFGAAPEIRLGLDDALPYREVPSAKQTTCPRVDQVYFRILYMARKTFLES